ncbi:MAG: Rieske 2Fe-2S domain-containing protein [Deltaproteobacteria bacterium]|nr:Rieske 2Fe-2S domain-containing protein [Deltaproteobacteria bacterium]
MSSSDPSDLPEPDGPGRRLGPPPTKPRTSVVRLDHHWFVACLSTELRRGRPLARVHHGAPIVLFRDAAGAPQALLDRCSHRNVPLSLGRVSGDRLACGYHGWEFDGAGRCQRVPGLCRPLDADRGRRVPAFAAREADGFVWVYTTADAEPVREPYAFPTVGPGYTAVRRSVTARGSLHATLENALDVPHTAYLHGGLFRTAEKRNEITAVLRRFRDRAEVEYVGEPRPSGLVGRLLAPGGGTVEHFDRFFLPGVAQVEYKIGDDAHFLVTSACTPLTDFETRLFALVQFKMRIPGFLLKPVLEPIANRIFAQDARVLREQADTIARFGGEQYESTEIDLLGPQIYRLLKQAERDGADVHGPGGDGDAPELEKTIRLQT